MKAMVTSPPQGTGFEARPLVFAGAVSFALHGSVLAAASWLWTPTVPPQAPPMVVVAVVTEEPVRPKSFFRQIAPANMKKSVDTLRQETESRRAPAQGPADEGSAPKEPGKPRVSTVWGLAPPIPPKPPSFRLHHVSPPRQVYLKPVMPDPRAEKAPMAKSAPVIAQAITAEGRSQTAKISNGESIRTPGASRPVAGLGNPAPDYPWISRRRGEQGRVILEVGVSADGRAGRIKVKRSSGWARLDQAALEAVKRWKFSPAMRNGRAVPGRIDVPISFRLMK